MHLLIWRCGHPLLLQDAHDSEVRIHSFMSAPRPVRLFSNDWHAFCKASGKVRADSHDFTYWFHLQPQWIFRIHEFFKIPPWHFHDHIIKWVQNMRLVVAWSGIEFIEIYTIASLAAIFQLDNLLLSLANAEERLTRDLFLQHEIFCLWQEQTGHYNLQKISGERIILMAPLRMFWYARSLSVMAAATVITITVWNSHRVQFSTVTKWQRCHLITE